MGRYTGNNGGPGGRCRSCSGQSVSRSASRVKSQTVGQSVSLEVQEMVVAGRWQFIWSRRQLLGPETYDLSLMSMRLAFGGGQSQVRRQQSGSRLLAQRVKKTQDAAAMDGCCGNLDSLSVALVPGSLRQVRGGDGGVADDEGVKWVAFAGPGRFCLQLPETSRSQSRELSHGSLAT